MSYYVRSGEVPHKRHTQFRKSDGALHHEEVMGLRGFSGIQSILYHLHPPTAIQGIGERVANRLDFETAVPLRHRLLRSAEVRERGDAVTGRTALLANRDVVISIARFREPMSYWYRYAHGDELLFIHEGRGVLESQFGEIEYRPGDYLVVPTGTIWRVLPEDSTPHRVLTVEAAGHIEPPRRYVNGYGQFLENSPYCERDIHAPRFVPARDEEGEFEVRVKARGGTTRYVYRRHPLDVVGWDGHLWPYALNIEDFEPITGRVHQPPPVHQTFDGPGFVVCSFVPRLFDYHPQAIPAPYNHSNVDSDEVIYYVEGDFMSRRGVERGALTVHPNGLPHGPHPGAYEGSIGKERTDELAVMVDTFRPLQLTSAASALEDEGYVYSWRG